MEHFTRAGKYELGKLLGGGSAQVYEARDTVLGRRVAVKILSDAGMADPEAKARFFQEARTASAIRHENIISVYDFGEDQGRPYMVMEFLEGESLRGVIRQGQLGTLDRRLRIALQIVRALDYIHSRKIVHRDIKPGNINIDAAGKATLMDFGIAKNHDVNLTRSGFTVGTPSYMAPEQVLGRPLTAQADVYSFGLLLYEMMTGIKPVSGGSIEQIFEQILYKPLDLAPLKAAGIPPAVCALIEECTEKQLLKRPANLGGIRDALERLLEHPDRLAAIRPAPAPMDHLPMLTATIKTPEALLAPPPKWIRGLPAPLRTERALMALAGLAAFAAVMLCYVLFHWI